MTPESEKYTPTVARFEPVKLRDFHVRIGTMGLRALNSRRGKASKPAIPPR